LGIISIDIICFRELKVIWLFGINWTLHDNLMPAFPPINSGCSWVSFLG